MTDESLVTIVYDPHEQTWTATFDNVPNRVFEFKTLENAVDGMTTLLRTKQVVFEVSLRSVEGHPSALAEVTAAGLLTKQ